MDWTGQSIAAIIGAAGGIIVTLFGNFLSNKRRTRKQNSDIMQDNYQTLYLEMRKEITRIQTEQSEERKQWAEERQELYKKVDGQTTMIHAKDIEIVELKAKVSIMEAQLANYETRTVPAAKNVTIKT